VLYRDGTNFDEAAALQKLIETYGCEQSEEKASSPSKKKKRSESEGEPGTEGGSPKKVKKTAVVQNEKNRGIAEFVKEMADIYFQNKDARKGGNSYVEHNILYVMQQFEQLLLECDLLD
jgi:hypothetical protein